MKLTDLIPQENTLQRLDESSLNSLFNKHFHDGFIIITSYRGDKSTTENKKSFEQLKSIIKSNNYSFIPVYGGFIENLGTPQQKEVREPALLVPNHEIASVKPKNDINKLKQIGLELVKKFNQDSYLFKPNDSDKSYYITQTGSIDITFTGKSVNDLTKIYFTDLSKSFSKKKKQMDKTTKRFTLEAIYINPSPKTVSEAHSRYGEQFFNLNN